MTHTPPKTPAVLAAVLLALVLGLSVSRPATAQDTSLRAEELEIWSDPDFRRRFVESYIAETDVEPKPTTVEEIDLINQTLELMRADQPDAALALAVEGRKNPTYSVLIDFFIANLRLNMAMNLEAPADDAPAQEQADYESRKRALLLQSAEGYRAATAKHAKYLRAWRNLGIVSLRLERFEDARDAFAKVVTLGGGDPDVYGLLGFCYTTLGDHLPAESAFRMANLLEPDKRDWKMGLVRSFLLQKRYPEAVALSGRMLEDDPTSDQLWLFQANAYIGMEQFGKAAENYEILDGLGKSSLQTLNMLANIYTNQGLFEPAVQRYARAIEQATDREKRDLLPQLLNAARVLSSRGEDARDATKTLIATIEQAYGQSMEKADHTALLRLRARIALAEGADDEQAATLEEVVALDPLDGEALILLGQHEARQQAWDEAIYYYERAANIEGYEADAKVRHAQVLVMSDRAAQALPLLRQAQQIKPRDSVQQYLEAVERMSK